MTEPKLGYVRVAEIIAVGTVDGFSHLEIFLFLQRSEAVATVLKFCRAWSISRRFIWR